MLIVLEGISGSGKSSQTRRLKRLLQRAASVQIFDEFSRGQVGRSIRRCYRRRRERFVRFHEEDLFADQTHLLLLADTIAKAEEVSRSEANISIVDRLFDSWLCYTLAAGDRHGLGDATVRDLYRSCSREHCADDAVTVFLELDTATALRRLVSRDGFRFDKTEECRLGEVARQFAELYTDTSILRVDAERPLSEVTAAIIASVGLKV